MNKIYKLVWSKTKNMYVAVCEFAKSHTKAPGSRAVNRTVVAGVLACILSCGAVVSSFAQTPAERYSSWVYIGQWGTAVGLGSLPNGQLEKFHTDSQDPNLQITHIMSSNMYVSTVPISAEGMFSAGSGITISGSTISAKPGTNVTVNSNGISVTGNGSVASGDTGLIDGGKLYAEVRPSDNGNYVKPVKIQHAESFCYAKTPGLCPSLKKQAVLFFLRPVHERAV